jgi:protein FLOWERING LOCUS T
MGIHRFVFVLFQQLGRQTVYAPGWRQNFNTRDFAELYNLGSPVAAVYFNCQREAGSAAGGCTPDERFSYVSPIIKTQVI